MSCCCEYLRGISCMRGYRYQAILVLACMLSACGSNPHYIHPGSTAYWTDPWWQGQLLQAVQSAVHMPTNSPHASKTGIYGTVQFLFANGMIENPKITVSTGVPELDQLMLQQVASAEIPKPRGPRADEPHEFELPLDMFTPFEALQYNIYSAIDFRKIYYRNQLLNDTTGSTTVDFDYLDSTAHNIVVTKSSGSRELDRSSIEAVSKAKLPPAPTGYAGKIVHIQVIFCYSINNSPTCPLDNNVIQVRGTRILRRF